MREYIEFPNANQRDEFVSAVDKALGYPKQVPGPNGLTVLVESWCAVFDIPGPPARYIAKVDEAALSVVGQRVTIKNRGGQDKQVTISLTGVTRGVGRVSTDVWEVKPPRGGLEAAAKVAAEVTAEVRENAR